MLAWARANGAHWDGIEFRVEANGNAHVVATRSLSAAESILVLPQHAMVFDESPRARHALAAWLANEARAAASSWRPYLDALPAHPDLPMFRVADDIAQLAGSAAHTIAINTNHDVRTSYDQLSVDVREGVSLADFAWAHAIVMSRAFHAPGHFGDRVALLPLVDLFDHHPDGVEWIYSPHDENLVVRTVGAFDAGQEVHFNYGARSNARLLVHLGFVMPDNPADEAELVFDLPVTAPSRARVAAMFDHRFLRVLSLARLHACEAVRRERILANLTGPTTIPFLGAATEDAALGVIATVARRALSLLDAHAVAEESEWGRQCAVVRRGERAVLEQIIEFARAAREHRHASCASDAIGSPGMLRDYLHHRDDEPSA